MENRDLKKLLIESFEMEEELYDFCIACLHRIYDEDAERAVEKFEQGIQFYTYNGCIQSLCCIDSQLEYEKERLKKGNENV